MHRYMAYSPAGVALRSRARSVEQAVCDFRERLSPIAGIKLKERHLPRRKTVLLEESFVRRAYADVGAILAGCLCG